MLLMYGKEENSQFYKQRDKLSLHCDSGGRHDYVHDLDPYAQMNRRPSLTEKA